jgi:hypothetical protein
MSFPAVPPPPPPKRARRPSKFIEGSPVTRPDLLQRTPTSDELFHTILAEMDRCEERKHQHRGSSSSADSLTSPHSGGTHAPQIKRNMESPSPIEKPKEGRRSINFGRRSLDLTPQEESEGNNKEKLTRKFKGRLRALTGGRERNVEPYPGT